MTSQAGTGRVEVPGSPALCRGRLVAVVPNRRGLWSRSDTTPFGQGRPYSRGQLERLLSDALFTPLEWSAALYLPPIDRPLLLNSAMAIERMGARLWPAFAGVILVEARKEMMAPAGGLRTVEWRQRQLVGARGTTFDGNDRAERPDEGAGIDRQFSIW